MWPLILAVVALPGQPSKAEIGAEAIDFLKRAGLRSSRQTPRVTRLSGPTSPFYTIVFENEYLLAYNSQTKRIYSFYNDRLRKSRVRRSRPAGSPRFQTKTQAKEYGLPLARKLGVPKDAPLSEVHLADKDPKAPADIWLIFREEPQGYPWGPGGNQAELRFDAHTGELAAFGCVWGRKVARADVKVTVDQAKALAEAARTRERRGVTSLHGVQLPEPRLVWVVFESLDRGVTPMDAVGRLAYEVTLPGVKVYVDATTGRTGMKLLIWK